MAIADTLGDGVIRVLLIDDDEEAHVLIRGLLELVPDRTYYLEWHPSPHVALTNDNPGYDVCLIDHNLDGWAGDSVTRTLRACGWAMPMLLLAGPDPASNEQMLRRSGADDALVKVEVWPAQLARAIRNAMDRYDGARALAHGERHVARLFEMSHDALLIVGPEGDVVTANAAAAALFGIPIEALAEASLHHLTADASGLAELAAGKRSLSLRRAGGVQFAADAWLVSMEGFGPEVRYSVAIRERGEFAAPLPSHDEVIFATLRLFGLEPGTGGEYLIGRSLAKLPGVLDVEVDERTQEATIRFERDRVRVEEMVAVVRHLGYRATPHLRAVA
ncbi:MAG: PAS domain-containing protein [Dehalococcoidia bacterium]|nr:PAS domain-containing protein [Dehalococcoidia bacterium]